MAFANLAALTTYVNTYLIANGMDSITGSQLNTTLNGVIQFLGELSEVTDGVQALTLGAGMSGEGSTIIDEGTVALPTLGAAATYGDSTHVPRLTIDTFGRVTGVTNLLIPGTSGTTFSIGNYTVMAPGTIGTLPIVTGLSFPPRFIAVIPKNTYTGGSFISRISFWTYDVSGGTAHITTTYGPGSVDLDWIAFQ